MCMFCRSLFVLFFVIGHWVVCPSSMYGFWLPLWYLQTPLTVNYKTIFKLLEKQSFLKLCLSFSQSQMICSIHITLQDFETHFKIIFLFFLLIFYLIYYNRVLFTTYLYCVQALLTYYSPIFKAPSWCLPATPFLII
jgi:hypothetical protein